MAYSFNFSWLIQPIVGMGLFSKAKKTAGWLSINMQLDGIYVVHVSAVAISKPQVDLLAFYPADKSPVTKTLAQIGKELHLERYRCTNLLNESDYQLLSVESPNVPRDELKTAVRWRVKDSLDFRIDDAVIDVLEVPVDLNAPERRGSLFVVAANGQFIRQRQETFEEAKLAVKVIDIPELAQRNISTLLEPAGRGVALLSCDDQGVLLTVTFGGELCLARHFDVSLGQLLDADPEQRRQSYDRITLELQRSFDHFESQFRFIAIAKLVVAPMGEDDANLQQYLASNLYMPVELLDLATLLDLSRVPELQQPRYQQRFFLALGAALRVETEFS